MSGQGNHPRVAPMPSHPAISTPGRRMDAPSQLVTFLSVSSSEKAFAELENLAMIYISLDDVWIPSSESISDSKEITRSISAKMPTGESNWKSLATFVAQKFDEESVMDPESGFPEGFPCMVFEILQLIFRAVLPKSLSPFAGRDEFVKYVADVVPVFFSKLQSLRSSGDNSMLELAEMLVPGNRKYFVRLLVQVFLAGRDNEAFLSLFRSEGEEMGQMSDFVDKQLGWQLSSLPTDEQLLQIAISDDLKQDILQKYGKDSWELFQKSTPAQLREWHRRFQRNVQEHCEANRIPLDAPQIPDKPSVDPLHVRLEKALALLDPPQQQQVALDPLQKLQLPGEDKVLQRKLAQALRKEEEDWSTKYDPLVVWREYRRSSSKSTTMILMPQKSNGPHPLVNCENSESGVSLEIRGISSDCLYVIVEDEAFVKGVVSASSSRDIPSTTTSSSSSNGGGGRGGGGSANDNTEVHHHVRGCILSFDSPRDYFEFLLQQSPLLSCSMQALSAFELLDLCRRKTVRNFLVNGKELVDVFYGDPTVDLTTAKNSSRQGYLSCSNIVEEFKTGTMACRISLRVCDRQGSAEDNGYVALSQNLVKYNGCFAWKTSCLVSFAKLWHSVVSFGKEIAANRHELSPAEEASRRAQMESALSSGRYIEALFGTDPNQWEALLPNSQHLQSLLLMVRKHWRQRMAALIIDSGCHVLDESDCRKGLGSRYLTEAGDLLCSLLCPGVAQAAGIPDDRGETRFYSTNRVALASDIHLRYINILCRQHGMLVLHHEMVEASNFEVSLLNLESMASDPLPKRSSMRSRNVLWPGLRLVSYTVGEDVSMSDVERLLCVVAKFPRLRLFLYLPPSHLQVFRSKPGVCVAASLRETVTVEERFLALGSSDGNPTSPYAEILSVSHFQTLLPEANPDCHGGCLSTASSGAICCFTEVLCSAWVGIGAPEAAPDCRVWFVECADPSYIALLANDVPVDGATSRHVETVDLSILGTDTSEELSEEQDSVAGTETPMPCLLVNGFHRLSNKARARHFAALLQRKNCIILVVVPKFDASWPLPQRRGATSLWRARLCPRGLKALTAGLDGIPAGSPQSEALQQCVSSCFALFGFLLPLKGVVGYFHQRLRGNSVSEEVDLAAGFDHYAIDKEVLIGAFSNIFDLCSSDAQRRNYSDGGCVLGSLCKAVVEAVTSLPTGGCLMPFSSYLMEDPRLQFCSQLLRVSAYLRYVAGAMQPPVNSLLSVSQRASGREFVVQDRLCPLTILSVIRSSQRLNMGNAAAAASSRSASSRQHEIWYTAAQSSREVNSSHGLLDSSTSELFDWESLRSQLNPMPLQLDQLAAMLANTAACLVVVMHLDDDWLAESGMALCSLMRSTHPELVTRLIRSLNSWDRMAYAATLTSCRFAKTVSLLKFLLLCTGPSSELSVSPAELRLAFSGMHNSSTHLSGMTNASPRSFFRVFLGLDGTDVYFVEKISALLDDTLLFYNGDRELEWKSQEAEGGKRHEHGDGNDPLLIGSAILAYLFGMGLAPENFQRLLEWCPEVGLLLASLHQFNPAVHNISGDRVKLTRASAEFIMSKQQRVAIPGPSGSLELDPLTMKVHMMYLMADCKDLGVSEMVFAACQQLKQARKISEAFLLVHVLSALFPQSEKREPADSSLGLFERALAILQTHATADNTGLTFSCSRLVESLIMTCTDGLRFSLVPPDNSDIAYRLGLPSSHQEWILSIAVAERLKSVSGTQAAACPGPTCICHRILMRMEDDSATVVAKWVREYPQQFMSCLPMHAFARFPTTLTPPPPPLTDGARQHLKVLDEAMEAVYGGANFSATVVSSMHPLARLWIEPEAVHPAVAELLLEKFCTEEGRSKRFAQFTDQCLDCGPHASDLRSLKKVRVDDALTVSVYNRPWSMALLCRVLKGFDPMQVISKGEEWRGVLENWDWQGNRRPKMISDTWSGLSSRTFKSNCSFLLGTFLHLCDILDRLPMSEDGSVEERERKLVDTLQSRNLLAPLFHVCVWMYALGFQLKQVVTCLIDQPEIRLPHDATKYIETLHMVLEKGYEASKSQQAVVSFESRWTSENSDSSHMPLVVDVSIVPAAVYLGGASSVFQLETLNAEEQAQILNFLFFFPHQPCRAPVSSEEDASAQEKLSVKSAEGLAVSLGSSWMDFLEEFCTSSEVQSNSNATEDGLLQFLSCVFISRVLTVFQAKTEMIQSVSKGILCREPWSKEGSKRALTKFWDTLASLGLESKWPLWPRDPPKANLRNKNENNISSGQLLDMKMGSYHLDPGPKNEERFNVLWKWLLTCSSPGARDSLLKPGIRPVSSPISPIGVSQPWTGNSLASSGPSFSSATVGSAGEEPLFLCADGPQHRSRSGRDRSSRAHKEAMTSSVWQNDPFAQTRLKQGGIMLECENLFTVQRVDDATNDAPMGVGINDVFMVVGINDSGPCHLSLCECDNSFFPPRMRYMSGRPISEEGTHGGQEGPPEDEAAEEWVPVAVFGSSREFWVFVDKFAGSNVSVWSEHIVLHRKTDAGARWGCWWRRSSARGQEVSHSGTPADFLRMFGVVDQTMLDLCKVIMGSKADGNLGETFEQVSLRLKTWEPLSLTAMEIIDSFDVKDSGVALRLLNVLRRCNHVRDVAAGLHTVISWLREDILRLEGEDLEIERLFRKTGASITKVPGLCSSLFVEPRLPRQPHAFGSFLLGFCVSTQVLQATQKLMTDDPSAAECQMERWIAGVLSSPLPIDAKRLLLLICCDKSSFWLPYRPADTSENTISLSSVLIEACPAPDVRQTLRGSNLHFSLPRLIDKKFGFEKLLRRKDQKYGVSVVQMGPVSLNGSMKTRYKLKVKELDLDGGNQANIEEIYMQIVNGFEGDTFIVYVTGLHIVDDLLLKWVCEFTERCPWCFVFFDSLRLTYSFPEIRDRFTFFEGGEIDQIETSAASAHMTSVREDIDASDSDEPNGVSAARPGFRWFLQEYGGDSREYLNSGLVTRDAVLLMHEDSNQRSLVRTFMDYGWQDSVTRALRAPFCILLLQSSPGTGKTELLRRYCDENKHEISSCSLDCSSDELVRRSLQDILNHSFPETKDNALLVADEYHFLKPQHKYELFEWLASRTSWLKAVLIANRFSREDEGLMEKIHASLTGGMEDANSRSQFNSNVCAYIFRACLPVDQSMDVLVSNNGITRNGTVYKFLGKFFRLCVTLFGRDIMSYRFCKSTSNAVRKVVTKDALKDDRRELGEALVTNLLQKAPHIRQYFVCGFVRAFLDVVVPDSNSSSDWFVDMVSGLLEQEEGLLPLADFLNRPENGKVPPVTRMIAWLTAAVSRSNIAKWTEALGSVVVVEQDQFPLIQPAGLLPRVPAASSVGGGVSSSRRLSGARHGAEKAYAIGAVGDYANMEWLLSVVLHGVPVCWQEVSAAWAKSGMSNVKIFIQLLEAAVNKPAVVRAVPPTSFFRMLQDLSLTSKSDHEHFLSLAHRSLFPETHNPQETVHDVVDAVRLADDPNCIELATLWKEYIFCPDMFSQLSSVEHSKPFGVTETELAILWAATNSKHHLSVTSDVSQEDLKERLLVSFSEVVKRLLRDIEDHRHRLDSAQWLKRLAEFSEVLVRLLCRNFIPLLPQFLDREEIHRITIPLMAWERFRTKHGQRSLRVSISDSSVLPIFEAFAQSERFGLDVQGIRILWQHCAVKPWIYFDGLPGSLYARFIVSVMKSPATCVEKRELLRMMMPNTVSNQQAPNPDFSDFEDLKDAWTPCGVFIRDPSFLDSMDWESAKPGWAPVRNSLIAFLNESGLPELLVHVAD